MHIHKISINPKVLKYVKARGLHKQFDKQVGLLLAWQIEQTHLKAHRPKNLNIRTFRINKQFRAVCKIEGNEMLILKIDNHQGY